MACQLYKYSKSIRVMLRLQDLEPQVDGVVCEPLRSHEMYLREIGQLHTLMD